MPILCINRGVTIDDWKGLFFGTCILYYDKYSLIQFKFERKNACIFINLILVIVIFLTGQGPILFSFSYYHYQNTSSWN